MISESILRAARITKYLPALKGLSTLRRIYAALLPFPESWTGRVNDFDGDLKLDVDPRECIGINVWQAPKLFERRERELFCASIVPGSIVLDVGANIGIYTLLAAKRGATVFAIEADPLNAECLRNHVKLNGYSNRVTIYECAATNSESSISLYRDKGNSGHSNIFSGADEITVSGRTIDSLELPPIDLCKMDIEGAEVLALAGMDSTIKRSPNLKVLVECATEYGHVGELLRFARSKFVNIDVVGKGPLLADEMPPQFCNLWLTQYS
jgi:FkbM family methyltransferase